MYNTYVHTHKQTPRRHVHIHACALGTQADLCLRHTDRLDTRATYEVCAHNPEIHTHTSYPQPRYRYTSIIHKYMHASYLFISMYIHTCVHALSLSLSHTHTHTYAYPNVFTRIHIHVDMQAFLACTSWRSALTIPLCSSRPRVLVA